MAEAICVRVAVRVRPFSEREIGENANGCVECLDRYNQISVNGRMFTFDSVFEPGTTQQMVYDVCAAPLVEKFFAGYNCTILAYGQTGSGKTYTMGTEETPIRVSSEERGMISRVVDAIFKQIGTSTDCYRVSASMVEVYEEKVIDLLRINRENLHIRESKGAVYVQGLSEHPVSCLEDSLKLLQKGCQLRSKGETAMNDKSSRSHAIFTLCIEGCESKESPVIKSKLHLVDLAGSERLKKTQAEGERMREGIKINEGLLALGNVIAALTDQNATGRYIPYRDAKITRLLQDSLGGNSYTVMIACVSPADTNADETLSTLRYADRAKHIKNKPIVNIDPNIALIQGLREELANVKHELAMFRAGESSVESNQQTHSTMRICKRCAELEKKNQEIQENYNRRNMQLAESIAENSKLVEQLLASQQTNELLRDHIRDIKKKCINNEFNEALKILDVDPTLRGPIEEEKDKDVLNSAEDDVDEETSDQAFVNRFNEKQTALNKNLANILDEIKQKELAFEATAASQAEILKMRDTYAAELEQLQAKLDVMEKEKRELLSKLKGSTIHHKLSEERRKRLHELERELAASRKRMGEIQKLEKENIRLQEQSKKMNMELLELKKLRVKMSKQIKDEEVKFRKWKVAIDRNMMQLKNRERKREVEIARDIRAKNLQLAVYRRKYEEANACNRRLQMQLAKCTTRTKTCCEGHFLSALNDELAVAYSAAEAEVHCQVLIEQRKVLSAQQQNLRKRLERLLKEPPLKRRTASDRSGIDDEDERHTLEEQLMNLDKEIELRGSELVDIQKKCTKAYSDEQRDQLWNALHNIAEAKAGLDRLFDATINERRSCLERELIIEEQRRSMDETKELYERKLDGMRAELKNAKTQAESLRKALTETQLCFAQQERDMINIWNGLAEGRVDLPDNVVRNMVLVKEAAKNFSNLQQAFEEQRRNLEKSRARLYHGRLRRRTGIIDDSSLLHSLSDRVLEEQENEGDLIGFRQTRKHRKPVKRLGVVADLDTVSSDEKEEEQELKHELDAACSKETDFNPDETYTVKQRKNNTTIDPAEYDYRSVVTPDLFEKS